MAPNTSGVLFFSILCAALIPASPARAGDRQPDARCAELARAQFPDTSITRAEPVAPSRFAPPDGGPALEGLPAFCRVTGVVPPAIEFEVWMPAGGWNGKLNGVGLGVYLGAINYRALAAAIGRGYAGVSTDAGHKSGGLETRWAIGHPEAIESLGYRAHHEMTVRAKEVLAAYYGRPPAHAYFTGCSSGGWQGLTEAQRYPGDYDGIVAGAPAINVVHLHAGSIWNAFQARRIALAKFALVADAVVRACDADDGLKDGLVEDPDACAFDPGTLQCRADDDGTCLTAGEVEAFQNIRAGAKTPAGRPIYPGWPVTSERGLAVWADPALLAFTGGTFRDLAFQGQGGWDVERFDFDRDVAKADAVIGPQMNSNSPDLRAFRRRGGKLILFHGWDDPLIPATNTIAYYRRIVEEVGGRGTEALASTQKFARLYLPQGIGHCAGTPGPGPHDFDMLAALEKWVERGEAPERIVASSPDGALKRPLCTWPTVPIYDGKGPSGDDASFVCMSRPRPDGAR